VPCVSGAPSNDEVLIPCLNVTSPPPPSTHAAAASHANSVDEVSIPHFTHHHGLLSCHIDAAVPPLRLSLPRLRSSTSPPSM
jgi:hypothetical protein